MSAILDGRCYGVVRARPGRELPYSRRVEASVVVSIVAVLVAACSLVVALRADRRAGRAEARSLRARLVVEPHGSSGDMAGRHFDVHVRNVGLGAARDVRVWLEDESGRAVSSRSGGNAVAIAPGEDPVPLMLTVAEASLPPPPVSFSVWVAWSDDAGHHERERAGVSVST